MCNCDKGRQTKEWAEDMAKKVAQIFDEEQEIDTMELNGEIVYIFKPKEKTPDNG